MRNAFVFLFALILSASIALAQPKLEIVGGDTYDWGDVTAPNGALTAKVQLKNIGNDLLVIKNVKPTCGCTTAPLDKNELQPGETATLDITLKPPRNGGHVSKAIKITTNVSDYEEVRLNLKANVIHPIELSPQRYMRFNNLKVGEAASSSITIKNNTKETVKFSGIKISPDFVNINIKKDFSLKPGEEKTITASFTPKKEGYFNASIEMATSYQEENRVKIRAYGNVKSSAIFNQ